MSLLEVLKTQTVTTILMCYHGAEVYLSRNNNNYANYIRQEVKHKLNVFRYHSIPQRAHCSTSEKLLGIHDQG